MRVLGNESRIFIVDFVGVKRRTMSEIASDLHIRIQNASKHVHRLIAAHLVEGFRSGKYVYYQLTKSGRWWRAFLRHLSE